MTDATTAPISKQRQKVASMFDAIASRYDLINQVTSFGVHKSWRNQLIRKLPTEKGLMCLDLATGTADIALTLAAAKPDTFKQIIGLDISQEMLTIGQAKVAEQNLTQKIQLHVGDACQIAYPDNTFDVVTISFGIRNTESYTDALREMSRVLKPGGKAFVLEFSLPKSPIIKTGYLIYLRYVLPIIGRLLSKNNHAYTYLNKTIEDFPYGQAFCDHLISAGFVQTDAQPLTFGIATLYTAIKKGR